MPNGNSPRTGAPRMRMDHYSPAAYTKLLVLEVVNFGSPRIAFGAIIGSLVTVVADQLLLLCVYRDHRLIVGLEGAHLSIDVLELGIAVGMLAPVVGLAVALPAVAEVP